MKPICLLLGGNILNTGVVDKFHAWGCDVVVIDWNESPALKGELHLRLDVKEPQPIIDALASRGLLDAVKTGYTSIDVAVPSLAKVLEACGLSVNSPVGLSHCFSKSKMTEVWDKAGILNRKVRKYTAWSDEITQWNQTLKLIVKPDNAASSRGITILEKETPLDDIQCAFQRALENATNRIVVVEEFVEGTEYTVEMLGDKVGNVAVYAISKKQHTQNTDRNKIAVKLHYNAVDGALQAQIAEVAIQCYKTLGFCNSLGHLEILQKPDGTFSPVEIGARSSGYIASHLVDIVSGRDFLHDLYEVQQGGSVQMGLMPQTSLSSVYYFYDLPVGLEIGTAVNLLDFCDASIVSLAYDRSGLTIGRKIVAIDNDNARIGFEILKGEKAILTPDHLLASENAMISAMRK